MGRMNYFASRLWNCGEHTYPETIQTADYLARIEPATAWEVALDGEASDLLEFISPDPLLGLDQSSR